MHPRGPRDASTQDGTQRRYVNPQTGGAWTDIRNKEGFTLSHSCL